MSNFQRSSSEQGRAFEDAVRGVILITGSEILEDGWTDPVTKEQVDVVARTPGGITFWVEAKGSWKGKTKGLERTDTSKKAVANAWHFKFKHGSNRPPYILVTTNLPKPGGVGELEIKHALEDDLFTAVITVDDLRATINGIDDGSYE